MAQIKKGFLAGFPYAQVWTVDDDGYAKGQQSDPNSVSDGTTTHAMLMKDTKTAGFTPPTRNVLHITGGDTWRGSFMFGIGSIDPFDLSLAYLDADLVALLTGSSVDQTTNAEWSVFGMDYNETDLVQVGLMLQTNFQSKETATLGANRWLNIIFPKCQISPNWPPLGWQAEAPLTYRVQPTMTSKWPNGDAFDSNQGWEDNQAVAMGIITDYPLALTTYVADGVATTFTAGYRPISSTVTINNTPNHFAVNGTPTALSSIVTTTGIATLAAAGSASDIDVLMYETKFVAI